MMYWTSVFFVGHISLPILAGIALMISPMIPKRPKIERTAPDDLVTSPENLSTDKLGSNNQVECQKSEELGKKKD